MVNDLTFMNYLIMALFSLAGSIMFLWKYMSNGQATAWRYAGLLLLGFTLHLSGMCYVRWLFVMKDPYLNVALNSWWWFAKDWMMTFILMMVALHFWVCTVRKKE